LLRVFVGRSGQEDAIDWDESGLLVMAKQELEQTLGITAEPLFSKVFRWEKAMPQYLLGHPQRLERLDAAMEKWPDMALAGNGYRGIGIPDCIHSGQLAVERVLGNLPGL
jgi:oxygen-dependent protoporphyrinogen oxidase